METTVKAAVALGKAILFQALKDIQRGDGQAAEAAAWLWTDDAALIMDACGYNAERVGDAIERALTGPPLRRVGAG